MYAKSISTVKPKVVYLSEWHADICIRKTVTQHYNRVDYLDSNY